MKLRRHLALLTFLIPAFCSASDTGFYLGGAIGATKYDDDDSFDDLRLDDDDYGGKVYGGYRLNRYLAFEASFASLGSYEAKSSQTDLQNDFDSLTISGVGFLPLGKGFSLFAQMGVGVATLYQDVTYISTVNSLVTDDEDDSAFAVAAGLGMAYTSPSLEMITFRAGWERYYFDLNTTRVVNNQAFKDGADQEIDLIYLGANYNF